MPYEAKVLAHSVSPYLNSKPLFTMQLRYPRFLHAEELTHRILNTSPEQVEVVSIPDGLDDDRSLSRNASSSRAIPVPRLIEDVRRDPAEPLFWGRNQAGMQAAEELDEPSKRLARRIWRLNRETCIRDAMELHTIGAHKQLVNRLLQAHSFINVVVTATNWSNFFALRRHKDAQPEIKHLADLAWEAQQASTPKVLQWGEWHLPYVTDDDRSAVMRRNPTQASLCWAELIKISVARCARVSYLTHEGKPPSITEDLALYDRLVGGAPLHASPAEHVATPDVWLAGAWEKPRLHGNLEGWIQHRKTLPAEFL